MSKREFNHVLSLLEHQRTVNYVNVASRALLLYDYLTSFSDEVNFIWRSKWSLMKLLLLITRYLTFIDSPIVFTYMFHRALNPSSCKLVFASMAFLVVAIIIVANTILTMRTCAIWGRSKWIRMFLKFAALATNVTCIIIVTICLSTLEFELSPVPTFVPCSEQYLKPYAYVVFVLAVCFDTVIVTLTVWGGMYQWKQTQSPLPQILYRDGLLYFASLTIISTANLAIIKLVTLDLQDILVEFQRALLSIMSAKMVLHLREACAEGDTIQSVSLDFRARTTRNDLRASDKDNQPLVSHLSLSV